MAMTRFERRRVDEYDRDEAALRRDERNVGRMEREQAIRDREADVYNAARRRRLESQNLTALADPGRYAPQVYRQAKQWEDESNLRAHERKMLEQQGENDFKVAEQKRFGMKEQGMDAAGIAAKTELAKAEEEWGARKSIAQTDAETKRYGFDKDFEGKKYGADKDLEAKKYGADATVDAETERQKGALAVATQQGKTAETVAGIQQSGAVGVAAQQARIAAAQQTRKDNQNTETLLQRERASLRKAHPNWTDEQIDAAARKNIGGEGGGLDRFRK